MRLLGVGCRHWHNESYPPYLTFGPFIQHLAVDTFSILAEITPMTLTAVLTPAPEGGYTALNPETGSTTQGDSIPEALANLKEATELYLEEFPTVISGGSLLTTFDVAIHA